MVTLLECAWNPTLSQSHNRLARNVLSQRASTIYLTGEHSRVLYITNVMANVCCLFDTGADSSVLPIYPNDRLYEPVNNLQVANGKPTATYSKRYIFLYVHLHKAIQ